MLDKRENSNTSDRIALVQDFVDCFGKDCIVCLLSDREFAGEQRLNFLKYNKICYFIPRRKNFKIYCPGKQKEITTWHLFHNMKTGELKHYS